MMESDIAECIKLPTERTDNAKNRNGTKLMITCRKGYLYRLSSSNNFLSSVEEYFSAAVQWNSIDAACWTGLCVYGLYDTYNC